MSAAKASNSRVNPDTKVPVRTQAKLKAAATEHMQALEKSPERVRKFFQDARVKSAHLEIDNLADWPHLLAAARETLAQRHGISHATLQPEVLATAPLVRGEWA